MELRRQNSGGRIQDTENTHRQRTDPVSCILHSAPSHLHLHRELLPAPVALKLYRRPVVPFVIGNLSKLPIARADDAAFQLKAVRSVLRVVIAREVGIGSHRDLRRIRSPRNMPAIVFPSTISPLSIIARDSTSGTRRTLMVRSPSSRDCPWGDCERPCAM